jgi:hypothetical protein
LDRQRRQAVEDFDRITRILHEQRIAAWELPPDLVEISWDLPSVSLRVHLESCKAIELPVSIQAARLDEFTAANAVALTRVREWLQSGAILVDSLQLEEGRLGFSATKVRQWLRTDIAGPGGALVDSRPRLQVNGQAGFGIVITAAEARIVERRGREGKAHWCLRFDSWSALLLLDLKEAVNPFAAEQVARAVVSRHLQRRGVGMAIADWPVTKADAHIKYVEATPQSTT